MSSKACARQTEERRKYGESFTTVADIMKEQQEERAQSVPSSPFSTSVRLSFHEDMIARIGSLKRKRHSQGERVQSQTEDVTPQDSVVMVPEETQDEIDGVFQSLTDLDKTKSASAIYVAKHGIVSSRVIAFRANLARFSKEHNEQIRTVGWIILFLLFAAYFGWVLSHSPSKGYLLIVITAATVLLTLYGYFRDYYGDQVMAAVCTPLANRWKTRHRALDW